MPPTGEFLETANASTAAGAALSTGTDTGASRHTPAMADRLPGWRCRTKQRHLPGSDGSPRRWVLPDHQPEPGQGLNVLDSQNGASGGRRRAEPPGDNTEALTGNANQEWDIQSAGNCGDIPANCTNPPLTATGNYYTIINKATGMLLTANGTGPDADHRSCSPRPRPPTATLLSRPAEANCGRSSLSTLLGVCYTHSLASSRQ